MTTRLGPGTRARGFTIVEVMVALAILALMAGMSWRAIDGMLRTQSATQAQSDDLLLVQTALSQWQSDLDAMVETLELAPIAFDGKVLRLSRREQSLNARGETISLVRVVAWTIEDVVANPNEPPRKMLTRWLSTPVATREDLRREWARAVSSDLAIRREAVAVLPARDWQLFFYRSDAWTNPQSSGDAARPPGGAAQPIEAAPDGVRLILNVEGGALSAGGVTKDWVHPQWVTARSS